jgi:hypothetical protein
MTESAISTNDVPLEAPTPEDAVSLEPILCTEELRRRPWRRPDYQKENHALVALTSALADSSHTILQTLAETILDVTGSDSSTGEVRERRGREKLMVTVAHGT